MKVSRKTRLKLIKRSRLNNQIYIYIIIAYMWVVISKDSIVGLYTCVTDAVRISKKLSDYRIFEVFPNSETSKLYLSKGG